MNMSGIKTKNFIRQRIWERLEKENLATFPKPCYGRIPNFFGSKKACERLVELKEFIDAKCVFCAPDYVLKRARELVSIHNLERNKILAVATPHMKRLLEIKNVPKNEIGLATNIRGFEKYGKKLKTSVALFIQGSVAVDLKGNRLGKGKGYGDKEYWYLKNHDLLDEDAKVITIVHETQIMNDFSDVMNVMDVKVHYILTPKRIFVSTTSLNAIPL